MVIDSSKVTLFCVTHITRFMYNKVELASKIHKYGNSQYLKGKNRETALGRERGEEGGGLDGRY